MPESGLKTLKNVSLFELFLAKSAGAWATNDAEKGYLLLTTLH